MSQRYRLLTLNIHKGFSTLRRRSILNDLRDAIRSTGADFVFLQEIGWQEEIGQTEFLADQVWPDYAYGKNAVYDDGHHGNAILSRFNFQTRFNTDISSSRLERRGFLYGSIQCPKGLIHAVCLHLSLRSRDRKIQAEAIKRFVESLPSGEPLILAGDFNDWTFRMRDWLENRLQLVEAHKAINGHEARTFPSYFPLLSLDRIYVRGFKVVSAERFTHAAWPKLSDHLGILAEVERC